MTQADQRQATPYVGRFAPSPSGALHFGSLIAALGSYLQARSQNGRWLLRMEDIDPPREVPGAADAILRTLEAYGLHWDGPVLYQSQRTQAYQACVHALRSANLAYDCACSRAQIAAAAAKHGHELIYPGTCRNGIPPGTRARAVRLKTFPGLIRFTDRVQGSISQDLSQCSGDFVIHRADGPFSYQLAVVVDDAAQGITEVVRGADLLETTARQIHLQTLLSYPLPAYLHLPIAVNAQGDKLSKKTQARALPLHDPVPLLWQALVFLNQEPPPELADQTLETFWQWAITHWRMQRIPRKRSLHAPAHPGPGAG